jgi:hypothetical protein
VNVYEFFLDELATRVAEKIATRDNGRINQRHRESLGPRRHVEAVKRRIKERQGGAYHVGRDWELTREALREELERFGPRGFEHDGESVTGDSTPHTPKKKKAAAPANAEAATLLEELDRELLEAGVARDNARRPKTRK